MEDTHACAASIPHRTPVGPVFGAPASSPIIASADWPRLAQASGGTTQPSGMTRPARAFAVPGVMCRYSIAYKFAGQPKVQYTDAAFFASGRVIARVIMDQCCQPFDTGLENQIIGAETARFPPA